MYLKSTFEKTIKNNSEKKGRQALKSENIEHSHLSFKDDGKGLYAIVDIDMPYIILYEMISIKGNAAIYQEYSERQKVLSRSDYEDFRRVSKKLHMHNFYELTYVLSGELTLSIEDEEVVYKAGDCCLCNKNIHHWEHNDNSAEFVLFLIKEEYVKEVFQNNFEYDENRRLVLIDNVFDVFFSENKKNPLYDAKIYNDYRLMDNADPRPAISLINSMITELSENQSGRSHMMKALFCRFFELLRNAEMYQEEIHWARLSNAENIVYQIAKAYKKKDGIFSRQEIEKITGYQSDYVERIFKKITGKTLLEYGKEIVVQKAADLLNDTDLSISDICEKLGYSNRNYFNKIFEAKYGVSPSEYRKLRKHKSGNRLEKV